MIHSQTTRRTFMGQLGFGTGMAALASRLPGLWAVNAVEATSIPTSTSLPMPMPMSARPVVSIFMDLPWVDMTGRAEPYVPPHAHAVAPRYQPAEDFGNYPYYMV